MTKAELAVTVSLQNEFRKRTPEALALLAYYREISGRTEPTLADLLKDIAIDSPADAQVRVAALLVRQLRLSGAVLPTEFESPLLKAVLSTSTPLEIRESAAIALQGSSNPDLRSQLLNVVKSRAPEPVAFLALRLTTDPELREAILQRLKEDSGEERMLFKWTAAFSRPFEDPLNTSKDALAAESPEFEFLMELSEGLPTARAIRRDFQVALAAVPFRSADTASVACDGAVITCFGASAWPVVVHKESANFQELFFDGNAVEEPFSLVVEPEGRPVAFTMTGASPTYTPEMMVLVANLFSAATELLSPATSAAQAIDEALNTPLPAYPGGVDVGFNQKIWPLVCEASSDGPRKEILHLVGTSRQARQQGIEKEDLTLDTLFTLLRDPAEERELRYFAAGSIQSLKKHPDLASVPIEQRLLEFLCDGALSRFSRHAASIALQDSEDESTIKRLCQLMREPEVGDFAAVAIRGASCEQLPKYYAEVINAADPEVRMKGYLAAMLIDDDPLRMIIARRWFLTKEQVALEKSPWWRGLRRIFPAVDKVWNSSHIDPLLDLGREFNPLNPLKQAVNSPAVAANSWARKALKELPLCSELYDASDGDSFIAATHDGTMPLTIFAAGFKGDKRVVMCTSPRIGFLQFSVPQILPLGYQIMGFMAKTLADHVHSEIQPHQE